MIHSILVLGPPGSGKSSLIRSALESLGGGAVAMAPGNVEQNSYSHLVGKPGYHFQGFDDTEFSPLAGGKTATGLATMIKWLRAIRTLEPKPPLVAIDKLSAAGSLAVNAALAKFNLSEPPAARSTDGSAYYSYLQLVQEELMRALITLFGLGISVIAASDVNERENMSEASYAQRSAKMIVPAIPGGFRDKVAGYFDTAVHATVALDAKGKPVHLLQWRADPKRPTKSRLGDLSALPHVANDWKQLTAAIEAAESKRAAAPAA